MVMGKMSFRGFPKHPQNPNQAGFRCGSCKWNILKMEHCPLKDCPKDMKHKIKMAIQYKRLGF